VQQEQLAAFKMKGIYLDDDRVTAALDEGAAKSSSVFEKGSSKSRYDLPAFNGLLRYARQQVAQSAEAMLAGKIAVNPYQLKGKTACAYCDFKSICGYDAQINGGDCRKLDDTIGKEQLIAAAKALNDNPKEDDDEEVDA
jgi:ATP-dependent helicase/nuclease subunit B